MSGRSLFAWFESSAGSCQDLKNWNLLQSGQALGIMTVAGKFSKCGCNLRRSPVVLPTAFPSE